MQLVGHGRSPKHRALHEGAWGLSLTPSPATLDYFVPLWTLRSCVLHIRSYYGPILLALTLPDTPSLCLPAKEPYMATFQWRTLEAKLVHASFNMYSNYHAAPVSFEPTCDASTAVTADECVKAGKEFKQGQQQGKQ